MHPIASSILAFLGAVGVMILIGYASSYPRQLYRLFLLALGAYACWAGWLFMWSGGFVGGLGAVAIVAGAAIIHHGGWVVKGDG